MEEKGCYKAKSGYRMETGCFDSPASRSGVGDSKWWKSYWKSNIPSKIKIFGWRAFKGAIPVDLQLRQHHIPTTGICLWCGKDWGSIGHTLILCARVRPLWKTNSFWTNLVRWHGMEFGEIMLWMAYILKKEMFELWLVTTWIIWRKLCKAKHEETPIECWGVVDQAQSLLDQFVEA